MVIFISLMIVPLSNNRVQYSAYSDTSLLDVFIPHVPLCFVKCLGFVSLFCRKAYFIIVYIYRPFVAIICNILCFQINLSLFIGNRLFLLFAYYNVTAQSKRILMCEYNVCNLHVERPGTHTLQKSLFYLTLTFAELPINSLFQPNFSRQHLYLIFF